MSLFMNASEFTNPKPNNQGGRGRRLRYVNYGHYDEFGENENAAFYNSKARNKSRTFHKRISTHMNELRIFVTIMFRAADILIADKVMIISISDKVCINIKNNNKNNNRYTGYCHGNHSYGDDDALFWSQRGRKKYWRRREKLYLVNGQNIYIYMKYFYF
ncbi:hypothetical protein RFI_37644 [Reticulomyxa filosa]|uniref:Uncharacterized protein n=1 Tax=Reticulomyxa filosa TaxID=46433 RepID=X6LE45_RETFI|nr:hypothetical protein RFI_37644 [Reticulomyxa filosa]|eukprot:ETN99823.1 hypothetical protein RFI_37644 [Reticulomyxa filosa]